MKGNVLGDIRAEHDAKMLEASFWQTTDYKALLESYDRCIVVGRRGTGKSALVHMLSKHWHAKPKTHVMTISPIEEQIIGLRDVVSLFGENYLHIKAGSKLAWRYAIYMELLSEIASHYRMKNDLDYKSVEKHLLSWGAKRQNISGKIRKKLISILDTGKDVKPATRISDLSDNFELDLLEEVLFEAISKSNHQFVIFADRLDEGYTPDDLGVAIVDGFIQSVIDIKQNLQEKVIAFAFVRDNIHRAISKMDPDFTRNIEGQVLRLHWDEYNLFNLVCNRMRIAFNSTIENNTRVWNAYTANELQSNTGFKEALKLTLYRPRDILVLLNDAFLRAATHDRTKIIIDDIKATANTISQNRLNDLLKEYENVFPALDIFTSLFGNKRPDFTIAEASEIISQAFEIKEVNDKMKLQDILLFEGPVQVIQRLYSVGFFGLYNQQSSSYVFCHDGKEPEKEFTPGSKLLLHPCYWLALSVHESDITPETADDIHDEYDIEVSSVSEEQRKQRIGALLQELNNIPEGKEGAVDFEAWALKAIKILFATNLTNIELHSNKNGLQQRDIIATNLADTPVWKRILTDYQSRQVVFEIKNYKTLGADEYRQVNSYLFKDYGRLAFIINRDYSENLEKHKELIWVKELYDNHNKLVIKLPSKFLERHLSKMRSPQKHDEVNKQLSKLLDLYIRSYLNNKCK
ncbi:ATP-binding protein [Salmonella enterica subsp. enterica serovar Anatum]|uniref:P-loop ATPase, Sll1717 family n=1 Tax=Enterobacter hormaechei TaxID=158836 RepID=UPI000C1EEA37|nr:HypX [Enterobacter hormaechei]EAM1122392.1 ATP-binding protein [Salmonella enterica]EDC1951731.1 ATP-binding protein [Salmonella enterica subsp. enterica serovar Newport]EBI8551357.1 ATP-binding protein [Salmonella enterica]EBJ0813686.1 ATP-binding protein [Salmonella enterica]ECS3934052.1 ATP-binding protein [Salmonella enterica]